MINIPLRSMSSVILNARRSTILPAGDRTSHPSRIPPPVLGYFSHSQSPAAPGVFVVIPRVIQEHKKGR